jgi:hypothetical protein
MKKPSSGKGSSSGPDDPRSGGRSVAKRSIVPQLPRKS